MNDFDFFSLYKTLEKEAVDFGENGIIKSAFDKKSINYNEVDIKGIVLSYKKITW